MICRLRSLAAWRVCGIPGCLSRPWIARGTCLPIAIRLRTFPVWRRVTPLAWPRITRLSTATSAPPLVVCLSFLAQNGLELEAPQEEVYLMFYGLASGEVSEAELAGWLRSHTAAGEGR